MRDLLTWRALPLVSAFCVLASVAKPAAAQTPAPAAAPAATPQPPPQLAAPPPAPPGAAPAPAPGYPGGYPPPPPGYAYPAYGAYPQAQLRAPDSAPYDGGPVPPGYHVEERPRRGLVIAGTIVLAVPYGLGLAVAGGQNFPNSSGWLIVPGLGPWLTLASRHKSSSCNNSATFSDCVDSGVDDTTRGFLIIDGLMQTAGAVMLIAGLASPKKVIAHDFVGSLHLAPATVGRTGYGGFLTGEF